MDRENVIKALQSILLSCKSGMVIHDLVKEFRETEGSNIPFRTFGCDTFVDFLRASGCFVVKPTEDSLVVLANQTANSKHVIDFVKGQTVSKKTRKLLRKKRSKLQYPRTPLDTIYENDRAMRYGTQPIRKRMQPQCDRRATGSGGFRREPLTQTQNPVCSQNNSNNRTDQGSVVSGREVVTVQERQSQPTAPAKNIQNERSLATTTKPVNCKLSKFSQALMGAMVTKPADLMPLRQQSKSVPESQSTPFDFAELEAYQSAVQAIGVYCLKKGLPQPVYQFIEMNTKKMICSVIVNEVRYGCYPQEYSNRDEAQMATAECALKEIKELEENKNYPVSEDSPHDIAQQISAYITDNGIFLDELQNIFQSAYQQTLPDKWRLIIENNTDLFKLETNHSLGKTIVYPNKINAGATGTIQKDKSFVLRKLTSNA